jgi:small subunit ribosomal protein S8
MSMNDTISDLLTRIRNGQMSNKKSISVPYSKMKESICKVMLDEGYIEGYTSDEGKIKTLVVDLKYFEGKPVIDYIKRVSRPGLRIYKSSDEIPLVKNGLGICIISTSQGLMTGKSAREKKCGGEIICYIS